MVITMKIVCQASSRSGSVTRALKILATPSAVTPVNMPLPARNT